jgi:hypothetical protein
MDAPIAVAALKAAIRNLTPSNGCPPHSDRGSQYASEVYRELLATHGLFVAGLTGGPELPAETPLSLVFEQAGDNPQALVHERTLSPRRHSCARSKLSTYVSECSRSPADTLSTG